MIEQKQILNAYQFRHACKFFDPTKTVSTEDFNLILETGRLSASSFGFEPWKLLVVQNKDLRNKLRAHASGAADKLDTASHFIVCIAMKSPKIKYDSTYIQTFMEKVQKLDSQTIEMKSEVFKNFQTKGLELNTDRLIFDWASKQSYIAMGNMMTTAAMRGIDSCPIEGFIASEVDEVLEKDFGINISEYGISYMLAIGYRKEDPKHSKTRRQLEDVVEWF